MRKWYCSILLALSVSLQVIGQEVLKSNQPIVLPIGAATSKVVASGSKLIVESKQSVTLGPGFHAQAGSTVSIGISHDLPVDVPIVPGNLNVNLEKNWILSRIYDGTGQIAKEEKSFYNHSGNFVQGQSRLFYNLASGAKASHVFATAVVPDAFGRSVLSTLPAPINNAEFSYKEDFLQRNASGERYSFKNFDLFKTSAGESDKTISPDPIWESGTPSIGSLAWYYSNSNTFEPYMPITGYPYTRTSYYQDGTGNEKQTFGVGENFKAGSGHELSSYVMPVINELNNYLQIRNKFFLSEIAGQVPTVLEKNAIQVISRDENGKEAVSIQDKEGNLLMSALAGNELSASNSISIGGGTSDGLVPTVHYFKLLSGSPVTIGGTGWKLYRMDTEKEIAFTSGTSLSAGYYKITSTSGQLVTLSYQNGYSMISYNYYNARGSLIATIAPEGVKLLLGSGLNSFSKKEDLPFANLFEYDKLGRLVKSKTTDGGVSKLVYRLDGNIRFSQDAVQAKNGRYSYTNYDKLGRVIESGEYEPGSAGIPFNDDLTSGSTMQGILENNTSTGGLTSGTKRDVVQVQYDQPDASHGTSGYEQDLFNLSGAVSITRKYSRVDNGVPSAANLVSSTWYNYDDEGRLLWTVKNLSGLGYKTTDYVYDENGNLKTTIFQKNVPSETFVHYYRYDASSRLENVYTNTSDNPDQKKLQAKYIYYLHGPLKRVELAGNLQGIDYTYTTQGRLKAINHPEQSKDPGKDGIINNFSPDAFGMTLEYFQGDYSRDNTGIVSLLTGTDGNSYTGLVSGQSWKTNKPAAVIGAHGAGVNNPAMFTYEYDDKYRLSSNKFGAPNFGNNTFGEAANQNREYGISYDANGNIKSLSRTDRSGTLINSLTYNYESKTNKLASVTNYANYQYNELGQLTGQQRSAGEEYYMDYDVSGKVIAIYSNSARTQQRLSFSYDENGNRVRKTDHQTGVVTFYVTDDSGNVLAVYDNNGSTLQQKEVPIYASGRIGMYRRSSNSYQYELTDHLGNVRAVVNQNKTSGGLADVVYYSDYYPFGSPLTLASNDYRYGYQGQYAETDQESAWVNFALRMYDPVIGRWMTTDPANQFASPYLGMGNNPVNGVDKDGGVWHILAGALVGAAAEVGTQVVSNGISNLSKGHGFFEGAIDNLDMADVGVAFIEGGAIAATGGASLGAKLTKEAIIAGTSTAVKSMYDVNVEMEVSSVFNYKKSWSSASFDMVSGSIGFGMGKIPVGDAFKSLITSQRQLNKMLSGAAIDMSLALTRNAFMNTYMNAVKKQIVMPHYLLNEIGIRGRKIDIPFTQKIINDMAKQPGRVIE